MVETQTLHLPVRGSQKSPLPYMIRTTCLITTALTIAGASWYIAVDLTSASDLTAIYNCSAFFAYAFSVPLLKEKLRFDKIFSVGVAIAGVLIVAYGDSGSVKQGDSLGRSVGRDLSDQGGEDRLPYRAIGNLIIGAGSVLYGLYEVLYKRLACPPEGTSPGRGMIFSQSFGSLIGAFTLLVLWIPLPILHVAGLETFELPRGEIAWMLLISVLANAGRYSVGWNPLPSHAD
jgi:drug/metabolite transporter (DMT)-like permease